MVNQDVGKVTGINIHSFGKVAKLLLTPGNDLIAKVKSSRIAKTASTKKYLENPETQFEITSKVMASFLRQIVAGPRTRHPEAGLDLCYVTDQVNMEKQSQIQLKSLNTAN